MTPRLSQRRRAAIKSLERALNECNDAGLDVAGSTLRVRPVGPLDHRSCPAVRLVDARYARGKR